MYESGNLSICHIGIVLAIGGVLGISTVPPNDLTKFPKEKWLYDDEQGKPQGPFKVRPPITAIIHLVILNDFRSDC
jgi:hypothetical protein